MFALQATFYCKALPVTPSQSILVYSSRLDIRRKLTNEE